MQDPIIIGDARARLDIEEIEEATQVLSESPLDTALTVGQQIAQHALGMRRKYGMYPVPPDTEPLPGHEDDQIIPFPDTSEKALRRRPLDRQDDRQRFRFWKMESFTKNLHEKAGVGKHKHGLGSRSRKVTSVLGDGESLQPKKKKANA